MSTTTQAHRYSLLALSRLGSRLLAGMLALLLASVGTSASADSVTYYHHDFLGSPVAATDESGAVLWQKTYRPYGSEYEDGGPAAEDNRIGYTGQRVDADLDLVYMQARYYDPVLGRFMAMDPVGFVELNAGSFNRYAYANNNPYVYVDTDGRYADVAIEVVSIGIGVVSFGNNIEAGNYGSAAVDAIGIVVDGIAMAVPIVPGASGIGIKAAREGGEVVAKGAPIWKSSRLDAAKFDHIFSRKHLRGGVLDLGDSPKDILNRVRDNVLRADMEGLLKQGDNTIKTTINGHRATIRARFDGNELQSLDVFKGTTARDLGNVIDLP